MTQSTTALSTAKASNDSKSRNLIFVICPALIHIVTSALILEGVAICVITNCLTVLRDLV